MKLLVDGVFYQIASTGIARVWSTLLPRLAARPDMEITMLDRGGCPDLPGVARVPFPSQTWSHTPADSLMIDRFAAELGADVFVSTYYTTPTSIPAVAMIYDMIPEVLDFNLRERVWREKEITISFAQYYACISANTRADLLKFYPRIAPGRVSLTPCGLDEVAFRPRAAGEIAAFRRGHDVPEHYFMLVGSRSRRTRYKNAELVFDALRTTRGERIHLLCAGGEPEIEADFLEALPPGITAQRLELTDAELSCAYAGAQALVYPSLYEGFGMPVIEAMACGCPVITTPRGSLPEVAGEAALFVSGTDHGELLDAMRAVRVPARREELVRRGLAHASGFRWEPMVAEFHRLLQRAAAERETPRVRSFLRRWNELRAIQAAVDVGT